MPTITVLMTAFNAENFIFNAIDSILTQTYQDFELLIINDGSTDNTLEIIEKINDPRIRIINNGSNKGLLYSRNLALNYANGEYLAIMDADDISYPYRFEKTIQKFEQHSDIAVIGGQADIIDSLGQLTNEKILLEINPNLIRFKLPFLNQFTHSSVIIRMKVFKEFKGYRTILAEDYDLFLRISTKYDMLNLEESLVQYRRHSLGTSKIKLAELNDELFQIKENYLNTLNLPSSNTFQKILISPFNWPEIYTLDYKLFFQLMLNRYSYLKKSEYLLIKKFIFDIWYQVLLTHREINTFSLLFTKSFFDWSFISAKHIRKCLKISLYRIIK